MNNAFRISCVLLAAALVVPAYPQIEDEHTDHSLEVSRVLPPELIKGPNHEVVDPVVNFFALDQFKIRTEFGEFEAYGQLMLRIRLREIEAIAKLKKQTRTGVSAQTVIRQGKKSLESVSQIARHPIKSAKGIGAGILNRFKKTVRDVKEDVETARSDASGREKAEIYADRWLGVEKARRRWSEELRIDPYTSNEVLKAELERVAEIEASAEIGTKFLMPSIPGVGFMRDVYKVVTSYDERELLEYNKKEMIKLGAAPDQVDAFLTHPSYSPTAAATLIAGVAALEGVENRLGLAAQAVTATSEVEALFFLESVAMALWFHNNDAPLKKIVVVTGLPAGITNDGRVVVFAAVDFPHWSNLLAEVIHDMQRAYSDLAPRHELLLAGKASRNFIAHVEELDWKVRTGIRYEYLEMLPWAMTDGEMKGRKH